MTSRTPTTLWFTVVGILLGLSFVHPFFWWTIFPGVFLCLFTIAHSKFSFKTSAQVWLAGTIAAAFALSWVWSTYPLDWSGAENTQLQIGIIALYWLSAAAVIGLGLVWTTNCLLLIKGHTPYWLWTAPVLWVSGGYIGSLFFSLLTLGPGSSIHGQFTYGYIGYPLLVTSWFDGLARYGEVYALSAWVILIVVVAFSMRSRQTWRTITFFALTLLLPLLLTVTITTPEPNGSVIISVETMIDRETLDYFDDTDVKADFIKPAVDAALAHESDYVLLPEDSRWHLNFPNLTAALNHLSSARSESFTLIDSAPAAVSSSTNHLQSYVFETQNNRVNIQTKQYLTPHGEYFPYLHKKIAQLLFPEKTIANLERQLSYRPSATQADQAPGQPLILFCIESISPFTPRSEAPFTAHLISHAWFKEPAVLLYQQDLMLKTRALWSRRDIVTAANMNKPVHYTASGSITEGKLLQEGTAWRLWQFEI